MKIARGDSVKLELSGTKRGVERRPDELVEAIFKVNQAGYVPTGVRVRSRVNSTMFTGELQSVVLEQIEDDTHVISVSLSKKLRLID